MPKYQLMKYRNFFNVLTPEEDGSVDFDLWWNLAEDMISDLGDVELNNGVTLKQLLLTARDLKDDGDQFKTTLPFFSIARRIA